MRKGRLFGGGGRIGGEALVLLLVLAGVIFLPVLMRPKEEKGSARRGEAEVLVIVTPHNEATRYEFTRAFTRWCAARPQLSGREIVLDWRTPGGASEISRYLASEYFGAFRYYWETKLGQPWNAEVQGAFDNRGVKPGADSLAARARKAFLESDVSCGVDLYFGGGSYDLMQQAAAGRLVDAGILKEHAQLFGEGEEAVKQGRIPRVYGGETFWDAEGRWFGAALAAFGICYNEDALRRLGITGGVTTWRGLADPRLRGEVALSDPTQSGSAAKAFEMLMQQEILDAGGDVERGWAEGLRLIRRIAANARYFTDSASKVPWDVEAGDAAAGMAIDFYGRFQSEAVRREDGTSRMAYVTPQGGSSYGADPIGILRGAPNLPLAKAFVGFVLSEEGQKLWNWKVGTPGGPQRYALRRLPILPTLYEERFEVFRSDPGVNPYRPGEAFTYHPEWTANLFRTLSFVIQVMAIDVHEELREAWAALIEAGFPPEATALFESVGPVGYVEAMEEIRPALNAAQKIAQVRLAKELCDHFRLQYHEVKELARQGK